MNGKLELPDAFGQQAIIANTHCAKVEVKA